MFDNVNDNSLMPQSSRIKCNAVLLETSPKLVTCLTCQSIELSSSLFTKTGKTYICDYN